MQLKTIESWYDIHNLVPFLAPSVASNIITLSGYDAQIEYSRPNPSLNQALANVVYVVRFDRSSPNVHGGSLWQLKMFSSENEDGTGRSKLVSEQILSPSQIGIGASAGRQVTFQINTKVFFYINFIITWIYLAEWNRSIRGT